MRFLCYILLGAISFFWSCKSVQAETIILVENGKGKAEIIVPQGATKQISDAAAFLQKYVAKSTGAMLPIKMSASIGKIGIHLGQTNYVNNSKVKVNSNNFEGFVIDLPDSKNLVLLGNSDWGTEYAVYYFLEKFVGILWLMPTELGEEVPRHSTLKMSVDRIISEEPAFLTRHLAPMNSVNPSNVDDYWGRINRIKKNVEFNHNLTNLFDYEKYGAGDKQFYPTLNGRKQVALKAKHDWQPNFNDSRLAEVASKRITEFFKKHPHETSYSLGINDSKNFDQSSESLKSRSGRKNSVGFDDVSNEYYTWVNEVVRNVNAVYPDKVFGLLAYNNVFDPPSGGLVLDESVIPFLTSERIRWANEGFKRKDILHTKSWSRASKRLGWYDYVYGNTYMAPRLWTREMGEYLKWANQNGVRYYVAELYPNWGEGPKAWVLSRLLWNPEQDVNDLLDTWYKAFAGTAAAPKVRAYFDLWEGFWSRDIQGSKWYDTNSQYLQLTMLQYILDIPKSYIQISDKLLSEAYDLAKSDIQRTRIDKLREMWNVYRIAILYKQGEPNSRNWTMRSLKNSSELRNALQKLRGDELHGQISKRLWDGYINK